MTETRDFPTEVIASISTGILMCDFAAMQEAAEYLMGHPIWTHHFGDKQLMQEMRQTLSVQCPGMPTEVVGEWKSFRDGLIERLGPSIKIRKGSGLTAMLPTDGVPPGVEILTVAR